MKTSSPRPFTTADGLVLVAATAAGLGTARWLSHLRDTTLAIDHNSWWVVVEAYHLAQCLALWWSLALLVLRLRQPRSARQGLCRQPGFAACVAVALTVLVNGLRLIAESWLSMVSTPQSYYQILFIDFFDKCVYRDDVGLAVAPAVLAVWFVQALGGEYEPEASWLDRTGRALGVYWVVSAAGLWPVSRLFGLFDLP